MNLDRNLVELAVYEYVLDSCVQKIIMYVFDCENNGLTTIRQTNGYLAEKFGWKKETVEWSLSNAKKTGLISIVGRGKRRTLEANMQTIMENVGALIAKKKLKKQDFEKLISETTQELTQGNTQGFTQGNTQGKPDYNSKGNSNSKDKEIKEKSQSLKKNNKLIKECEKWLDDFNKICNTNFKTLNILVKNYTQWRKVYTYEEMSMAIQLAHVDEWFKNKLTPQLLLRTRNKNGECDYIGELLNKCKGNYDLFNKLLLNGREKKIKFEKEQKEKAEKQREIVEKQKTKLEKIRKQKQLEEKIEREKQEKNMLPTGTFYVKKNRNIGAIDFN